MFKKDIISGSSQAHRTSREQRQALSSQGRYSEYIQRDGRHKSRQGWLLLPEEERHRKLMKSAAKFSVTQDDLTEKRSKTDLDLLKDNLQFLYDEDDTDDVDESTTGRRLALAYFRRLYREYALCDLSRENENKLGLRWRTESEVIKGKGQYICGNLKCDERADLDSYELPFGYTEGGCSKSALVKARLCPSCLSRVLNLERRRKRTRKVAQLDAGDSDQEASARGKPVN